MKLYQNIETKDLVVIREQYEDGSVKIKHLHAPVWEKLTKEAFESQYKEITSEEELL
jgi:hypothetical protein